MALSIVRNDITKMKTDAIVNSTNEHLQVGGLGVDASIHAAAGPELEEALLKIGNCPVGSVVVTDSFNIKNTHYIIHAVGPVHKSAAEEVGNKDEEKNRSLLRACYHAVLAAAIEHKCKSVAMPLISAGANGFPKETAYAIATATAREFLLSLRADQDIMIYLVLYDNDSIEISAKVHDRVLSYISGHYRDEHKKHLQTFYEKRERGFSRENIGSSVCIDPQAANNNQIRPRQRGPKEYREQINHLDKSAVSPKKERQDTASQHLRYEEQDRSFAEMCEWWCEQKKITKNEFYTRANITRAAFWNMKHNPEQTPKKTNVLACAIGLKLNLDETGDLLMRAGMTLSRYYKMDVIVEYYIREKNYNIDDINAMLFEEDQPLLGSVTR